MELKKAIYFTLDSIIAGGIVLTIIMLLSSFYSKEPDATHLNYLSNDLISILGSVKVKEIGNSYIKSLINDGTITNLDNTVLQQIGEFWADNEIDLAKKTALNVTEPWLSTHTGSGVWINNEVIYNKDVPVKMYLISSKKMISGIAKGHTTDLTRKNPPTLWGPAIIEVRLWE